MDNLLAHFSQHTHPCPGRRGGDKDFGSKKFITIGSAPHLGEGIGEHPIISTLAHTESEKLARFPLIENPLQVIMARSDHVPGNAHPGQMHADTQRRCRCMGSK